MDSLPKAESIEKPRRRPATFTTYLSVVVFCEISSVLRVLAPSPSLLFFALDFIDLWFVIALFYWRKWAIYGHLTMLIARPLLAILIFPEAALSLMVGILSVYYIALFIYMLNINPNNNRPWPQFE